MNRAGNNDEVISMSTERGVPREGKTDRITDGDRDRIEQKQGE